MKTNCKIIFLLSLILISSFTFAFSGGTGSVIDPYLIANCNDLHNIRTYLYANYALKNDVNCYTETHFGGIYYNSGLGFEPIGKDTSPFIGTFDGRKFVISNLFVNRTTFNSQASLFGYIKNSSIKNTGFEKFSITGDTPTGTISASSENSTIANVYSKDGNITGQGNVGGLIGWTKNSSIINSYSNNILQGLSTYNIGGLIGFMVEGSTLANSFFIGKVYRPASEYSFTGTVIGINYSSPLTNVYWLDQSGDNASTCHPTGDTGCTKAASLSDFYSKYYGVYQGTPLWEENWIWDEINLPKLGKGSSLDPIMITDCNGLQNIKYGLSKHYALANDINCYNNTHAGGILYNSGAGFDPIGFFYTDGTTPIPFTGSIDGRNKIIYDLYINRGVGAGLISIGKCFSIKNLGLKNSTITGSSFVGSLAGYTTANLAVVGGNLVAQCYSFVKNSYAIGTVNGTSIVGGLFGNASEITIINSYFDGNVTKTTAEDKVGGIAGNVGDGSLIKNSFVKGNITAGAGNSIGGITGLLHNSTITNSYNLANITTNNYSTNKGGIAGSITSSAINNSFSRGTITIGNYPPGEVVGSNTSSTITNSFGLSSTLNFFSNTNEVYTLAPIWNDGNWFWSQNFYPQLTAFPYCTGTIDPNAEIYPTDWTGLKTTDNLINVLSTSNTSQTCEWHCKNGYQKGTGTFENTCFPPGTINNPIMITDCNGLQNIKNKLDANYALANDINCYNDTHTGGILYNSGAGFEPIGKSSPFIGSIDGRNKIIYGLHINQKISNVGLISTGTCATIKNLGLKDANIIGSTPQGSLDVFSHVGGIAGLLNGDMTNFPTITCKSHLTNSFVIGTVKSIPLDSYATGTGGLIGQTSTTVISNSYFDGNVISPQYVGGIAGGLNLYSSIKNCFTKGKIGTIGSNYAGGIVGWLGNMSSVENSYNFADVNTVNGTSAAGLVAQNQNGSSVVNSFSVGTVTGFYNTSDTISEWDNSASQINLYGPTNPTSFYSSTHPVYTLAPIWNDGNWIWMGNFFPQLTAFPYCIGSIDENAIIYPTDWTGLKTTDNQINILSNSNTSQTCEWHCKNGYTPGTGINSNKCVLETGYSCTAGMDSNAIPFSGDLDNVPENETQSILVLNSTSGTLRKCEYYCRLGYYKGSGLDENKCLPYLCTGPVDTNASICSNDNIDLNNNYSKLLVQTCDDTRKCQFTCNPDYIFQGGVCVKNTINPYYCVGEIDSNAIIYTDDNIGLTQFVPKTLTDTDTIDKCQYHCRTNYNLFINGLQRMCIPSTWIIPKCPSKKNYFPGISFPENGIYCEVGNPNPAAPVLDNSIGSSVTWKCTTNFDVTCTAKRVDPSVPVSDACSILSLKADIVYVGDEKTLVVDAKCSCNTTMNLIFTDYINNINIPTQLTSFVCGTDTPPQNIGFATPVSEETLLQVKANIEPYTDECSTCEMVTYVSYQTEQKKSTIPDNSFIFVVLIVMISIAIIQKKRI